MFYNAFDPVMCPACSNERTARQTVTKQRPKSHDQRYPGGGAVARIFFSTEAKEIRKFGPSSRSPQDRERGGVIGNGAATPSPPARWSSGGAL